MKSVKRLSFAQKEEAVGYQRGEQCSWPIQKARETVEPFIHIQLILYLFAHRAASRPSSPQ